MALNLGEGWPASPDAPDRGDPPMPARRSMLGLLGLGAAALASGFAIRPASAEEGARLLEARLSRGAA